MITAIVQFELASAITLAEATRRFESSAPKYQNLAGLIRKYYIRSEDGRTAGGVYLWESRQAAERLYDEKWREFVEKLYGSQAEDHLVRHSGRRRQSRRRRHHESSMTMQHDDNAPGRTFSAAAAGAAAVATPPRRSRRGPRARSSGSTWTSRSSTTPTTRSSMRPTASRSASAASSTASGRARRSARRSAWPMVRPRSSSSTSTAPSGRTQPVNIFVHGGAWRANRAADYALLAEPFVSAGAHYVILDFINVDEAGGSLFPMVEQVRRAVGWVYRNAKSFGGDPDRLYLTSHSSGSHLGGCVVTHDWRKEGLPVDILKGATLSSGMYDLKPVRLSKRSKYVKFTDEMEQALSAQRHLDQLHTPLILAHGTYETPEFQRQTRDFHAAVKAAGKPVELLVGGGLQPLRDAGDAGEPVRPARPRGAGADAAQRRRRRAD